MSNSIYLQATGITGIYIQAIARRSREIAADIQKSASAIEEIGIYIMEILADSRETDIYWSEIATYSREITADIGEIGINCSRTATRSLRMPRIALSLLILGKTTTMFDGSMSFAFVTGATSSSDRTGFR